MNRKALSDLIFGEAEELRIHLKLGLRRFCEKMRAMRTPQLLSVLLIFGLLTGSASAQGDQRVARESARRAVIEQIEKAWTTSGTKESLRLIVIVVGDPHEGRRVFPKGVKHLPQALTPRVIYCCQPECTRAVQYLGLARRDGFTFAAFRFLTD